MNPRVEALLWANRVLAKKSATAAELLEVKDTATIEEAQAAFHKIAKLGHPDLHRGMDAEDLEKVTSAYARVADAYQQFRTQKMRAPALMRPVTGEAPRAKRASDQVKLPGGGMIRSGSTTRPPPAGLKPPTPAPAAAPAKQTGVMPPLARPATPTDFEDKPATAPTMSGKAMLYYRKTELALKSGDLRGAVLNLKLAVAADPTSQFLRQALVNLEAELKKP